MAAAPKAVLALLIATVAVFALVLTYSSGRCSDSGVRPTTTRASAMDTTFGREAAHQREMTGGLGSMKDTLEKRSTNGSDTRETAALGSPVDREMHVAIMFNFHARTQKDKAKAALKRFAHPRSRVCTGPLPNTRTTLIMSVESDDGLDLRSELLDALPASAKSCFSTITMLSGRVPERLDVYPAGASRQFHSVIQQINETDVDYVFMMEPDTYPIVPNWLDEIVRLARSYEMVIPGGFWMLGSLPRGGAVPAAASVSQRFHINGNAIYHIGDRKFANFLERVKDNRITPQPWQQGPHGHAFDVDIMTFILQPQNYRFTQAALHKFTYSPFILNMWRASWDPEKILVESPGTFFVHGGSPSAPW